MEIQTILQNLIRFNTTNPPGNEKPCADYLRTLLEEAGISCRYYARDERRPNLYARLKGKDDSPPLLLYGHMDVVGADSRNWTHPPFGGDVAEGCVWGRGALDMKSGLAMMTSAVLRCLREGCSFPGDVILCFVSDEEIASEYGARFLVENHPELFAGVQFAIGEFGGFPVYLGGKKYYFIQVAEKKVCRLELEFSGQGGHGSSLCRNTALEKMTRYLSRQYNQMYPAHLTPVVKEMVKGLASAAGFPLNLIFRMLTVPFFAKPLLKLMNTQLDAFQTFFRNIANPTIIKGGEKINVIPETVSLQLDGRVLPGVPLDTFKSELKRFTGNDVKIKVLQQESAEHPVNYGKFTLLKSILSELDPEAAVVPCLLPGTTDGQFFSRLGIQSYGFIPMDIPRELDFNKTIHAANERIPLSALHFGSEALYRLLKRF